ncbi:uncharacterized protein BT62DRAFT_712528 [Guyanagaster necrorhizus]|uniref:Uncharacterized protein n=1 Tax=Guyanagaster necrorhizus TaxID=856835 RepID=A0A9P8AW40_9AGAR|nr:uncharacterized protein BT62DRAFT_712528 [Guyanagaster necrorhizus MCA 3950]KAG7448552.1 hypothetical protein BT62DRAFT_712528 [Guyanagaster necrorhizus MCA 3950]
MSAVIPFDIPSPRASTPSSESSLSSSMSSSSGLYVPIHKRTASRSSSTSRATTPESASGLRLSSRLPIYNITELLNIGHHSYLADISCDAKTMLHDRFPEIVKGLEWKPPRNGHEKRAGGKPNPRRQPGRTKLERSNRRKGSKVAEELSWRGRTGVRTTGPAVPLTPTVQVA